MASEGLIQGGRPAITHCPFRRRLNPHRTDTLPMSPLSQQGQGLDKGARILKNRYSPDERPHSTSLPFRYQDLMLPANDPEHFDSSACGTLPSHARIARVQPICRVVRDTSSSIRRVETIAHVPIRSPPRRCRISFGMFSRQKVFRKSWRPQ